MAIFLTIAIGYLAGEINVKGFSLGGACGNPAILAYSNRLAPTDRPDIA